MDRLCAVVATDHPLAKKRSMTLHELAKHPLILMVKDSSSRQIVDLAFNREGLVSNVAYETTYGTTVAGLAQAGLGVGILPESMAAPSRLHQLRIRGEALTRRISIIMRAGRSLSPTADKLKQMLESVAASADVAIRLHSSRAGGSDASFRVVRACFSSFLRALRCPGCELVGGIFKAGMAVGVFLVIAVVALVIFLVSKVRSRSELVHGTSA